MESWRILLSFNYLFVLFSKVNFQYDRNLNYLSLLIKLFNMCIIKSHCMQRLTLYFESSRLIIKLNNFKVSVTIIKHTVN